MGKLTVARELAALTGFKLFHNHLTVNLVASIFPHQSEPYFRLIRQIWRDVFAEAVSEDLNLICTAVYRGGPEYATFIRWMQAPIFDGGGCIAYVQLRCDRGEWLRRVQDPSRQALDKLVDPFAAAALAERFDFCAAVPFEPHLCIDITSVPAATAARRIAEYFSLPGAGRPVPVRDG